MESIKRHVVFASTEILDIVLAQYTERIDLWRDQKLDFCNCVCNIKRQNYDPCQYGTPSLNISPVQCDPPNDWEEKFETKYM